MDKLEKLRWRLILWLMGERSIIANVTLTIGQDRALTIDFQGPSTLLSNCAFRNGVIEEGKSEPQPAGVGDYTLEA